MSPFATTNSTPASPMPLVTAVMLTQQARVDMAREAIKCFRSQTYPNKRMLVIVEEPELYDLYAEMPDVSALLAPTSSNLGDRRNLALEHIGEGLVIQWDDDDLYHEGRMEIQAEPLILDNEIDASYLTSQIVVMHDEEYVRTDREGIDGTVMHRASTHVRYPSRPKREDTIFRMLMSIGSIALIDNSPYLYVRRFHGHNTWDESHFERIRGQKVTLPAP